MPRTQREPSTRKAAPWSFLRLTPWAKVTTPCTELTPFATDLCVETSPQALKRKARVSVSVAPAALLALIEVRSLEAPMWALIAARAALFGFRNASAICPGENAPVSTAGPRFGPFSTSVEVAVTWHSVEHANL